MVISDGGAAPDQQNEGGKPAGDDDGRHQLTELGISWEAKAHADATLQDQAKKMEQEGAAKFRDVVVYIGPSTKILKYSVRSRAWTAIRLDPRSSYKGNIKHHSTLALPEKGKIIMTGGVSVATCAPLGFVFEFDIRSLSRATSASVKNLRQKRYAHCSQYLRGKILVFGGFAHQDVPDEPP